MSLNLRYALIGATEQRDWGDAAREGRVNIPLRLHDMGWLQGNCAPESPWSLAPGRAHRRVTRHTMDVD